jgi:hypothetical protein
MLSFVPYLHLDISIERINWQFEKVDFNILTLTVRYKGGGLPILFEMLDKKGNSNKVYIGNVEINGMRRLLIGLKQLQAGDKNIQEDYLAVITNQSDKKPLRKYRKRWYIEVKIMVTSRTVSSKWDYVKLTKPLKP